MPFFLTGTVHLLVVSGLNVAILAAGLHVLVWVGWLPRRVALALIVAVVTVYTFVAGAEPPARPNVVFVVADDMGWRDTGFQGSPHAKTPHLDDMASKGVRFDYFYPGQQMCSPGRFAILTGRNPCRTGLHHLGAMRPQEITLARALKTAGYRTGAFVSAAVLTRRYGLDQGFDTYDDDLWSEDEPPLFMIRERPARPDPVVLSADSPRLGAG